MGLAGSSRQIIPLTTPEALDVSDIWDKWLHRYIPDDLYKELNSTAFAKFRLQLLFATVAPIPRAVQYVVSGIQEYFCLRRGGDVRKPITSEMLDEVYLEAYSKLEAKYKGMRKCPVLPKHVRALLFKKEIVLDAHLTKMIMNTLLVNPLEQIKEDAAIVPKTSVLSMKLYAEGRKEEYWRSILCAIESLDKLFFKEPNKVKLGHFLAAAVQGFINAASSVRVDEAGG